MRTKEALVMLLSSATLLITAQSTEATDQGKGKPHIVFILADDLGWNDISWNNQHVLSPNLEALAKEGVILSQSYVQPICTPTRSALMTGRYPYTIGRQHGVIRPKEPTGLTLERQLLPEALKKAGYSTHIVGKWHLGFCSWDYVPTSRGFDTFWGYYLGSEDYYHHTRNGGRGNCLNEDDNEYGVGKQAGYDFRNNTEVEYSVKGEYSTYTFASYTEDLLASRDPDDPMFLYLPFQSVHAPLEVPKNYTKPFAYIKDEHRRTKLGMVLAMDEAVGRVTKALKDTGHYNNSVIIFSTDNGAPISASGNNWPLRGHKGSCWEGGTRGPAFVHSPLLEKKGVVSNELIHVTDWFPTIAGLAGGKTPDDIDGLDQWDTIAKGSPSQRTEMVYNIYISDDLQASIRMGDYKLLVGKQGDGSWTPPPEGHKKTSYQDISVTTDIPEPEEVSENTLQDIAPDLANNEPKNIPEAKEVSGKISQEITPDLVINEPKSIPEPTEVSGNTLQEITPDLTINEPKNITEPKEVSGKTVKEITPDIMINEPKSITEPKEVSGNTIQEITPDLTINESTSIPEPKEVSGKIFQEITPDQVINEPKSITEPKEVSGNTLQEITPDLTINEPKSIPEPKEVSGKTLQEITPDQVINEPKSITEPKEVSGKTFQITPDLVINEPKNKSEPKEVSGKISQDSAPEPMIRETNQIFGNTLHKAISDPVIPEPDMTGNTLQETIPEPVTTRKLGLDLTYFPVLGLFAKGDLEIQLYNIMEDPEERKELSVDKKDVVVILLSLLERYLKDYVKPDMPPEDPAGNPKHFNGTWSPGWCEAKR